jgi:hypothetical protein
VDCMIATSEEIAAEHLRLQTLRRREPPCKRRRCSESEFDFWDVLTKDECRRLQEYIDLWIQRTGTHPSKEPNAIVNLGVNPIKFSPEWTLNGIHAHVIIQTCVNVPWCVSKHSGIKDMHM